jgi:hypothetical protein
LSSTQGVSSGQHGGAEGAAAFAFARLAVDVVVVEDALHVARHAGVEVLEGVQHHLSGVGVVDLAVGCRQRRVDVVAAQLVHAQPLRFEGK